MHRSDTYPERVCEHAIALTNAELRDAIARLPAPSDRDYAASIVAFMLYAERKRRSTMLLPRPPPPWSLDDASLAAELAELRANQQTPPQRAMLDLMRFETLRRAILARTRPEPDPSRRADPPPRPIAIRLSKLRLPTFTIQSG